MLSVTDQIGIGSLDEIRAFPNLGGATQAGSVRQGDPLLVRGWAVQPPSHTPFHRVILELGGHFFEGAVNIPRRDVAVALDNLAALNCGFIFTVATDELSRGLHRGAIVGLTAEGERFSISPVTFIVRASPPPVNIVGGRESSHVRIDDVRADSQSLFICGWALDDRTNAPASRVIVSVGDTGFTADYGIPRPDVGSALGLGDDSTACGFYLTIPIGSYDEGAAISAHGISEDGIVQSSAPYKQDATSPLPLESPHLVMGAVDRVEVLDGTGAIRDIWRANRAVVGDEILIHGWAVGVDGADAEIIALLDGVRRIPVPARLVRPDLAGTFPRAHRAGFVASIRLADIEPGIHEIELFVHDNGRMLPTSARAVVTVT